MTQRERLFAAMQGKPFDRLPNLNIIMQFAAREINVPYSKYCQDFRLQVQGNIEVSEKYSLDCVTVMSDPMREASAFGCDVVFPEDGVPYPKVNLLQEDEDLLKLKVTAPCDSLRMSQTVQAIELYKKQLGNQYPVIGWVEGCMAESADLRGVTEFLMDLVVNKEFVTDLMDICLEQAIVYAKAQIEAGADIIGVGDAISSVAGPSYYEEFALPYQEKLLKAIQEMGAKTKLHICGNTEPFLTKIPIQYCDIFDVDWMVPLDRTIELYGGRCLVSGNYDPVTVLLQGDESSIDAAVRSCATQKGRYATSGGCEVPKFTPQCNLLQVAKTVLSL